MKCLIQRKVPEMVQAYLQFVSVLTSKIILCSPKQKVEPKGLVLLADEDLRKNKTSFYV